jgi:hypothetical protein
LDLSVLACVLSLTYYWSDVGNGALTFLTGILEWAGVIAMIAAVVFFAIYYIKSRKAPSCDIDCDCKDESTFTNKQEQMSNNKTF